jgi:hypothetical protein
MRAIFHGCHVRRNRAHAGSSVGAKRYWNERGQVLARSLTRKKTDVAEHPEAFRHVGLLVNSPPGSGQVALYIVFRCCWETNSERLPTGVILSHAAANTRIASSTSQFHIYLTRFAKSPCFSRGQDAGLIQRKTPVAARNIFRRFASSIPWSRQATGRLEQSFKSERGSVDPSSSVPLTAKFGRLISSGR